MKRAHLLVSFALLLAISLVLSSCIGTPYTPGSAPFPSGQQQGDMGGGGMMGGGPGGSDGMMGGGGGMMGQGGMGGGMMGGGGVTGGQSGQSAPYSSPYGAPLQAITIDQALGIARKFAISLANPEIALDQVEEFTNNFYAKYKEKSTGIHAFEMLIDKSNGRIYPEPGPNITWNTKYGSMSSATGPYSSQVTPMSMTPPQALSLARSFLDNRLQGATAGDADAFYGYYTVEVKRGDRTLGMLSVNGYSGQVWYHNWHGDFIQRRDMLKAG